MADKFFIAYCTSGLGNRLRPLAAAIAYCRLTGRKLRVYWDSITPNGCLTPLERLYQNQFDPISLAEIEALAGRSVALFTEKGPGHGVTREAERFGRDQLLKVSQFSTPQHAQALKLDDPHETVIVYDNDYLDCVPRELSIAALRSLVPAGDIRDQVLAQAAEHGLTLQTKGVHARGTDFGLKDALDLYSGLIRDRIGVDRGEKFFLSTEDAQLEQGLRELFPSQLMSRHDRLHLQLNEGKAVWGDPDSYTVSADHGVDALKDIYLLSCVNLVVFHPGSTFAEISRHLHGVLQEAAAPVAATVAAPAAAPLSALEQVNSLFVQRCTQMLPRGGAKFPLSAVQGEPGPAPLETVPPEFIYWETLGYKTPILERMIMVSSSTPVLHWDAERFNQWVEAGLSRFTEADFRTLCPYPEALSQIAKLQSHIRGSKILVIGSETYWLELLCCLFGAAEVTTVEYREIHWDGELRSPTPVRTITWDQYLQELDRHEQAYDMVLSYSSIEHSGLGRYGDRFMPLGDLYTFLLMSRCIAPHGMCAVAVPVGQDLTHFNAHRIYGVTRMRALEQVGEMKLIGMATPDEAYLASHETEAGLRAGWSIASLATLPLGKLRQPVLCFGQASFSNENFAAHRMGRVPAGFGAAHATAAAAEAPQPASTAVAGRPADPHQIALQASAQAIGGARFVEVTHVRPFGFSELEVQRVNVSVDEALAADPAQFAGIQHCFLHVLLGCGVPQARFIQTLRWALQHFEQVHILEHNAASSDWEVSEAVRIDHCIANCLNSEQLYSMARLLSLQVSPLQRLPGWQSPERNVLFTLAGKSQALRWDDVAGFYGQVGLTAQMGGKHSFQSWNDVYLGTAEAVSLVQRHIQQLHAARGRYVGKSLFASCGGFFSLDQMQACSGQGLAELVLFDVNPFTVSFAQTVHRLIKGAPSRRDFLQAYLLAKVEALPGDRFQIDARTPFEARLRQAAEVGALYGEDIFNILRSLLFARLQSSGLQVWGMRNVGDNRIDVAARLDLHANQERFIDSNCLINGEGSWLSSEGAYLQVRNLLLNTPTRYVVASIEALDSKPGDLMLASNIFDFVPPAVRQKIAADVL